MARVTALRPEPRNRVAVELDGGPWRTLPVSVVVRAGVREGRDLDREALRLLRRELRRHEALAVAGRTLRHRDLSRHAVAERLARTGASAPARADALDALQRAGFVDDERLAAARAASLAQRGHGDAAIRVDLERRGIDPGVAVDAVAALENEAARARRIVETRGATLKTAAFLDRRGFSADVIEGVLGAAIAEQAPGELE